MADPNWNTPKWILDLVRKLGPIDLDPCSNPMSIVGARHEYGNCPEIPGNGLWVKWEKHRLIYVNMPFDTIYPWTRKAKRTRALIRNNPECQICMTVPADRTETKAWDPIWESADVIALTKSRVNWLSKGRESNTTRGSTAIVYWGLYEQLFTRIFASKCRILKYWE